VVSIEKLGCHPKNRYGAGLIPADVHYVLEQGFLANGFNPTKWECLTLSIPDSEKAAWLAFNQQLVQQSEGFLADIVDLDLVTGRGSHGTAALRAIKYGAMAVGTKGTAAGRVSMASCLELQPSLAKPLQDGILVTVLPGELEQAVPGLFAVLSEVGNVSNSVFRLNTALQTAIRCHQMASSFGAGADINWDQVAKLASRGLPQREAEKLPDLCSFVQVWSGGDSAHILKGLEVYEKSLSVRRKIRFEDFGKLAACKLEDVPNIVPVACRRLPHFYSL